jgi:hypothetical protein
MTAHDFHTLPRLTTLFLLTTLIVSVGGCSGDGGTKPEQFGAVEGVVRLPFKLAASGEPIEGVSVHLTAGDFDTVTTTDATGAFFFAQIPARQADLSAAFGSCLSVAGQSVVVRANDTVSADLSLESHADRDTISVGWAGATRMEIDPATNRAILLYDAAARGGTPGIVTLDLTTGQFTSTDLSDVTDVYDLEIINSNKVVFNFKSAARYGLRFFDPVARSQIGSDVIYPSAQAGQVDYEGRLAIDAAGENVFVTHVIRAGSVTKGKIYAVSVSQQQLLDADDDPFDGEFAFDADLVANSILWAYNIAFDDATNEILVGNRTSATITAVDWTMWGQFDRGAGLSVPTAGVRVIDMTPPPPYNDDQGFGAELWGFAGGNGIASKSLPGKVPILHYESGAETWTDFHVETIIFPASTNHVVKIIPQRHTWFTAFRDPGRDFEGVIAAIEERPFGTLQRLYRYESRFIEEPGPRAFAIDAANKLLYVAYDEYTFLEVFCLP